MAKHKINVVLIESGDFEFDEKTQSLYGGFSTGREYSVSKTRARFLGGTTNWWGSMCGPFHEIDFEPKEYCSNYDGWPIQRSELDKYYQKAHHYLDLDDDDYDYSIDKCREYSKTNKTKNIIFVRLKILVIIDNYIVINNENNYFIYLKK